MRILGEEALCRLPTVKEGKVETPCGTVTGKKKQGHSLNLNIHFETLRLKEVILMCYYYLRLRIPIKQRYMFVKDL